MKLTKILFLVMKREKTDHLMCLYDKTVRSLVLKKLAWKSLQALKFSQIPWLSRILDKMLRFHDFSVNYQISWLFPGCVAILCQYVGFCGNKFRDASSFVRNARDLIKLHIEFDLA